MQHAHTHTHTHTAPAARLASRTVKLATREQTDPRTLLGKGEGKKAAEQGETELEPQMEMEMEGEGKKEERGHDRVEKDERQHNGEKTRLRVVNESEKIRVQKMREVKEVIQRGEDTGSKMSRYESGNRDRDGVTRGNMHMTR